MIRFLQTPGPTKKIILGGMLLVICAAMVITLVPGGIGDSIGLGGPGQGVVAKVAGEPVTTVEVQREARQMLRQQFPRGGAQAEMLLPYFAERAAQTLISRKALVAEAERLGLRVTDEEARDELQHGQYAATFPGGQIRRAAAIREHSAKCRSQRAHVRAGREGPDSAGQAAQPDHRERPGHGQRSAPGIRKQNTKVKFDYAVLRKDDLMKQINPSESELRAFYERNKATYNNSIPEKRKIQYVVLDTAKIEAGRQRYLARICRLITISIATITAFPSRSTSAIF